MKNFSSIFLDLVFRINITLRGFFYSIFLEKCGKKFKLAKPIFLTPKSLYIGNNVYILKNARLQNIFKYNKVVFFPKIIIGNNVSIEQNIHLTCAKSIFIGEETAIAANVSITDITHPYENINIAPEKQDIEVDEVYIGSQCKIYNNVVILPGVKIGKHCVIGANSLIRKGIYPDYSIIVGNPAKIVKKYNFISKKWEKYDN